MATDGRIMVPETETLREQWVRMAWHYDYTIDRPSRGVMVAICRVPKDERDRIRGLFGKGKAWIVDPMGTIFENDKNRRTVLDEPEWVSVQ